MAEDLLLEHVISLATTHKDKWGDPFHHLLAAEIVRLRYEIHGAAMEMLRGEPQQGELDG